MQDLILYEQTIGTTTFSVAVSAKHEVKLTSHPSGDLPTFIGSFRLSDIAFLESRTHPASHWLALFNHQQSDDSRLFDDRNQTGLALATELAAVFKSTPLPSLPLFIPREGNHGELVAPLLNPLKTQYSYLLAEYREKDLHYLIKDQPFGDLYSESELGTILNWVFTELIEVDKRILAPEPAFFVTVRDYSVESLLYGVLKFQRQRYRIMGYKYQARKPRGLAPWMNGFFYYFSFFYIHR